jgi:hypothetical protein
LIPGSSEDAFFQPEVLRRDWHFATYDNGIRILATIGVEMPELRSCMESYLNKWFSVPDDCTNLNLVCDWWESISSTIYHFPSVVAAALVFHAFNTFSAPLPVPVFLCPFMPGFCLEMEGTDHRSLSYPQRLCSLSALGTFDIFTREIDERAPPLPPTILSELDEVHTVVLPHVVMAEMVKASGIQSVIQLYKYTDHLYDRHLFETVDQSPLGAKVYGVPVTIGDHTISCVLSIVLDRCLNLIRRYLAVNNTRSQVSKLALFKDSIFPTPAIYYFDADEHHQTIMCMAKCIEDFHFLPARVLKVLGVAPLTNARLYAKLMHVLFHDVRTISSVHASFMSSLRS